MDQAIFKFRQAEDASLSYIGRRVDAEYVGGFSQKFKRELIFKDNNWFWTERAKSTSDPEATKVILLSWEVIFISYAPFKHLFSLFGKLLI